MKSCPVAEVSDSIVAWQANSGWLIMNPTAAKKIPPSIIDHTVKRQENRFAPNIIWMVDILYTENSSDCQLEVKLSNAMYPRSIIAP